MQNSLSTVHAEMLYLTSQTNSTYVSLDVIVLYCFYYTYYEHITSANIC